MAIDDYDDALPDEKDVEVEDRKVHTLSWANIELGNARLSAQIRRDHTLDVVHIESLQLNPLNYTLRDTDATIRPAEANLHMSRSQALYETGISLFVGARVLTRRGATGDIVYSTPGGAYLMVYITSTARLPELCWYSRNGRAIYDVGTQHDIISVARRPDPEPV